MAQPTTVGAIAVQTPKPRIVQHKNRRYSIRLEPVFWRSLEGLAERGGIRLGQFIGELANGYEGNNFASHLRVICMVARERALAEFSLGPTLGSLLDVVDSCPSPGLLLSRDRTIVASNRNFLDWLGEPERSLAGADLTSVIQVRTRRPLNDVWADLVQGRHLVADANVLHVAPGRAVAATARLRALHPEEGEEFYVVMWLSVGRRPAPEGARQLPPTAGPAPSG